MIFDLSEIIVRLKEINVEVSRYFDVENLEQETDMGHLHILLKTASIELYKAYYISCTTGQASLAIIKKHVESRGER